MESNMNLSNGWWSAPKNSQEVPTKGTSEPTTNELLLDLKRSSDDLAAEVWELKGAVEFLLKVIEGK